MEFSSILQAAANSVLAIEQLKKPSALSFIHSCTQAIVDSYSQGGKVLIAGNGGSLCDAMHFAEELTGYFRKKRKALAAMALSDPGHISCVANDQGYDHVFSRWVEAVGREGDVFVSLTTSGNSQNLVKAVEQAKKMGIKTVAFLGKGGGKLFGSCDLEWVVTGFSTSDRIQEAHMAAIHIIIEMVEKSLGLA